MAIEVVLQIFSGRPDLRWTLDEEQEAEFHQRLERLRPALDELEPQPPGLGYRGFLVQFANGHPTVSGPVRVYGGMVWQDEKRLKDPNQELERWLLHTGASSLDSSLMDQINESFARS